MKASTITAKGQTTIPKKVRDHLGLKAGDKLDFVITRPGQAIMIAVNLDISDLQAFASENSVKKVKKVKKKKAGKK